MKKLLVGLICLVSMSSFASVIFTANEFRDRGSYVEVIKPHIIGCASGQCFGGDHYWYLKPSFNKNKVCKELGFKSYIKGSIIEGLSDESEIYSRLVYHVFNRTGYPGAPAAGAQVESIGSIDCSK